MEDKEKMLSNKKDELAKNVETHLKELAQIQPNSENYMEYLIEVENVMKMYVKFSQSLTDDVDRAELYCRVIWATVAEFQMRNV